MGIGFGIEDWDWGLRLGIGDWGLEIGMGDYDGGWDWEWGLGLGIVIEDLDWGLGFGIRIEEWHGKLILVIGD